MSAGDKALVTFTHDNKPVIQRFQSPTASGDYSIPAITHDRVFIPAKVSPPTTTGDICIPALTHDREFTPLKVFSITSQFITCKLFSEKKSSNESGINFGEVAFIYAWSNGDFSSESSVLNRRGLERSFFDDQGLASAIYKIRMIIKLVTGGGTLFSDNTTLAPIDPGDGLPTITVDKSTSSLVIVKYFYEIAGSFEENITMKFKAELIKDGSFFSDIEEITLPLTAVRSTASLDIPVSQLTGNLSNVGSRWYRDDTAMPELQTNGDFANWTADDPDDWVVTGESAGDPEVSEVGIFQGHGGTGTGACNLFSTTGDNVSIDQTVALSTIKEHNLVFNTGRFNSGILRVYDADNLYFDETFNALTSPLPLSAISIIFTPLTASVKIRFELVGSGDVSVKDILLSDVGTKKDVLTTGFDDTPIFGDINADGTNIATAGFFIRNDSTQLQYTLGLTPATQGLGGLTDGITSHDSFWSGTIDIPGGAPNTNMDLLFCPYNPEISSDTSTAGLEPRFKTIDFNDPVSTLSKSDFHFSNVINRENEVPNSGKEFALFIVFLKKVLASDFTGLFGIEFPSGEDGFSFIIIAPLPSTYVIGSPVQIVNRTFQQREYKFRSTNAVSSALNTLGNEIGNSSSSLSSSSSSLNSSSSSSSSSLSSSSSSSSPLKSSSSSSSPSSSSSSSSSSSLSSSSSSLLKSSSSSGDDFFDFMVLLLHMDGTDGSTNFKDSSASEHTITASGDVEIDTAVSKFGGASGLWGGTDGRLNVANSADWDFDNDDFTIDFWLNTSASVLDHLVVIAKSNVLSAANFLLVIRINTSGTIVARVSDGTSIVNTSSTADISDGTFHHVAVVRDGNTIRLFIDGTQEGTNTMSTAVNFDSSMEVSIGSLKPTGSNTYTGSLDELRILNGLADYTSNFTPPTSAYLDPPVSSSSSSSSSSP